jgi:hypothetical protein
MECKARFLDITYCMSPDQTLTDDAEVHTTTQMLEAEIEFWQSMIEGPEEGATQQAIERMIQACKLAERKLLMIQEENLGSESRKIWGQSQVPE